VRLKNDVFLGLNYLPLGGRWKKGGEE